MQDRWKDKLIVISCWAGMALITGYSYLSSRYLSGFAELHITIPKINLPVFMGKFYYFLSFSLPA